MSIKNFVDLSVVRLSDGRKGTIVHLYADGQAACMEIEETNELVDVELTDIDCILWEP